MTASYDSTKHSEVALKCVLVVRVYHREKFRIPKLDFDPQSLGGKA